MTGEAQSAEADSIESKEAVAEGGSVRVPWSPFVAYLVAWLVFAAVTLVLFGEVPADATVVGQEEYPIVLFAAAVLALMGPMLALLVWGVTWYRLRGSASGGTIFARSLLRSAIMLLLGVAGWWGALMYVDVLRLARI